MKFDKVELVFILDRSGSMSGLESDTIGGFNSMLKKQQTKQGEANVTTVLFDDRYELLHDRLSIKSVDALTENEYFVRGSTALLDAVGRTINKTHNVQKSCKEEYRAQKVMFVIITDGMENSSKEYDYKKIKSLIKRQKEDYGWEFIFLGANIDSEATANNLGIDKKMAVNYHADKEGLEATYVAVSSAVDCVRESRKLDSKWRNSVDKDYITRKHTK